jgi:hypothetical protein
MNGMEAFAGAAFFLMAGAVVWAAAFAWSKWLGYRQTRTQWLDQADEAERVERLEGAVELLTQEVERLSAMQRQTTRLLEDRLPRSLPPRDASPPNDPERVITPH